MLAHILVDDGCPEAGDYDNNYYVYDATDPQDYARALEEARAQNLRVRRSEVEPGLFSPRSPFSLRPRFG